MSGESSATVVASRFSGLTGPAWEIGGASTPALRGVEVTGVVTDDDVVIVSGSAAPTIAGCSLHDNPAGADAQAALVALATTDRAASITASNLVQAGRLAVRVDAPVGDGSAFDLSNNWWGTDDGDAIDAGVFSFPDSLDVALAAWDPPVAGPVALDSDGDGAADAVDPCALLAGADPADGDGDGVPDACDLCPADADADQADGDGDGVGDACDACPGVPDHVDLDEDGTPDVCDDNDDGDGVADDDDACPRRAVFNAWGCECPEVPQGWVCVPPGGAAQTALLFKATEVTQAEWRTVMGDEPAPSHEGCDDCPMDRVSWLDSVAYCNALSAAEGLTRCYVQDEEADDGWAWPAGVACEGYRLPTRGEWVYAGRAGAGGDYLNGRFFRSNDCAEALEDLGDTAWFKCNSGYDPHPVAQKVPNAWGLFDVHGNVYESVWDRVGDTRTSLGGMWGSDADQMMFHRGWLFSAGHRNEGWGLRPARSVMP